MILKGSERGSAKQLALHLLNDADNDHVEVHELRGFVSDDLINAMKEAQAVSRGTKCQKFLFSVSLNPPDEADVPASIFEEAINRIEAKNGLEGHPRAIVFHEKNGRRHAHCVWSHIDAENITAKNLSHYKRKLQDVSRELYLEHGWTMPRGLLKGQAQNPLNYSLAEWQQAKRAGKNARDLKAQIQDAWAISDNGKSFSQALKERGFILAKGDRRGHVAVDYDGEVYSVARYTGKKAKEICARLGNPESLPSVDDARKEIAETAQSKHRFRIKEANIIHDEQLKGLDMEKDQLKAHHQTERQDLSTHQKQRWEQEVLERSRRLHKGLKGFWQRLTGKQARLQAENEKEALAALERDQKQRDDLIAVQLEDRRTLQQRYRKIDKDHAALIEELRKENSRLAQILDQPQSQRPKRQRRQRQARNIEPEF